MTELFANPAPETVPLADKFVKAPVLAAVEPIGPGAANVAPPSVAALTAELQPNAVPVHCIALVAPLQVEGVWNEYAPAPVRCTKPVLANPEILSSAVPLALAAFVPPEATGMGEERPVIVPPLIAPPVMVGDVIAGEVDRTAEPDPVDVVAPVPPFAAVSGFCSVRLLNVGEGYVWANAIAGTSSAVRRNFFIGY